MINYDGKVYPPLLQVTYSAEFLREDGILSQISTLNTGPDTIGNFYLLAYSLLSSGASPDSSRNLCNG